MNAEPLLYARTAPPAGAPETAAELNLEPEAGRGWTPSPEDWRDQVLYSVVLDRFARSERGRASGDPADGRTRHGGDLPGALERLDYVAATGATALLLTPVTQTVPEAYHGYAPVHLLGVDPHLGTMGDYRRLVRAAHARGLLVVQDLVLGHAGPVFEYRDDGAWDDGRVKPVSRWTRALRPLELNAPEHFCRMGAITDWNDARQAVNGDFPPNYRSFETARPLTQDLLIRCALWWIKEGDLDGLRLDAVRHLDPSFLERFCREVRAYAARLGKTNFLLLGENSTGRDEELKPHLEPLDTVYHYPAFRRDGLALRGLAPTRELELSQLRARETLGEPASRLLRFIDLHDTYRFLRPGEPERLLRPAFAYLLLSEGMPLVYYGTEQGFRQAGARLGPEGPDLPADPGNREDMFPGGTFRSYRARPDAFDPDSPPCAWLRKLAALRRRVPALRRGLEFPRWSDPAGPGLYAFSRIHEGVEVLVVLNTSLTPRAAEPCMDAALTPPGTVLRDALDPAWMARCFPSLGASRVAVSVPGLGARVLVRAGKNG